MLASLGAFLLTYWLGSELNPLLGSASAPIAVVTVLALLALVRIAQNSEKRSTDKNEE